MAPFTVGCSLNIYEAEANDASSRVAAAGGGVIEICIRLRYQLYIKAYGMEELIEDVSTPEFCTAFSMPVAFLLPELSVSHVSNMLQSVDVDANACEYLSPKIAEFAVRVAKRHGAKEKENSLGTVTSTVAKVEITKVDFILEEEYDRIAKTINW